MKDTVYHIPGAPYLALVADLHGDEGQEVIRSLRCHRPSLICIPGDLIRGSCPGKDVSPLVSQPSVLPFLKKCADVAPTFLSMGNHEQGMDTEDLEAIGKTGVTILDQSFTVRDGLVLGGLTSACVLGYRRAKEASDLRYPKLSPDTRLIRVPETDWLESFAASPGYHILLSHHPEYYPSISGFADLILSGHAHGGQWRFFGHGLYAPGQGFWPRYTRGVYEGRMVVSAGISNPEWCPRLFNPTEVVYINEPG